MVLRPSELSGHRVVMKPWQCQGLARQSARKLPVLLSPNCSLAIGHVVSRRGCEPGQPSAQPYICTAVLLLVAGELGWACMYLAAAIMQGLVPLKMHLQAAQLC